MAYLHKLDAASIFHNTLKAYPEYNVVFYSGSSYINNRNFSGWDIVTGTIDLNEINVNRGTDLIQPYIVKDGNMWRFKSITTSSYNAELFGTQLTGAYPYTASVTREYFFPYVAAGQDLAITPDGTILDVPNTAPAAEVNTNRRNDYFIRRQRLLALKNTMNYYRRLSNKYHFTGSYVSGTVNLINIPKIMYGSSINKGSVSLKMYFTGTLIDEATDERRNGELISKGPNSNESGSVVGVVLYNEGVILLTSSVDITSGVTQDSYAGDPSNLNSPRWTYFASHITSSVRGPALSVAPSSSVFSLLFEGINPLPVMTMFLDAPAGDVNNSQNTTWISSSAGDWRVKRIYTDSGSYAEPPFLPIKNTIESQYCDYEEKFEKQTFISQIGIFDEDKNLLGIAKVANPVIKKESDSITFKLKLDL